MLAPKLARFARQFSISLDVLFWNCENESIDVLCHHAFSIQITSVLYVPARAVWDKTSPQMNAMSAPILGDCSPGAVRNLSEERGVAVDEDRRRSTPIRENQTAYRGRFVGLDH